MFVPAGVRASDMSFERKEPFNRTRHLSRGLRVAHMHSTGGTRCLVRKRERRVFDVPVISEWIYSRPIAAPIPRVRKYTGIKVDHLWVSYSANAHNRGKHVPGNANSDILSSRISFFLRRILSFVLAFRTVPTVPITFL